MVLKVCCNTGGYIIASMIAYTNEDRATSCELQGGSGGK